MWVWNPTPFMGGWKPSWPTSSGFTRNRSMRKGCLKLWSCAGKPTIISLPNRTERRNTSRLELQAQLPKLKKEKLNWTRLISKVLQMVLHQLYSNLKTLSQLKKNGKRVGRLRFKVGDDIKPSSTTKAALGWLKLARGLICYTSRK